MYNEIGSEWNRWDLHIHTRSSYDYGHHGEDAEKLLCKVLHENGIKVAAITDHYVIDAERISKLRGIAPDIVFFPGVELRTDKGGANIHVILIFPEDKDIFELSENFRVMRRNKAKHNESEEEIYWDYKDIIDFAHEEGAIVSIHAGKKKNGIDKEITDNIPFYNCVKKDIGGDVHIYEVRNLKDVSHYMDDIFKDLSIKPVVICSDCHNPNKYEPPVPLWIKADCTFEGLKQCLYQPLERVFLGPIPPLLSRVQTDKQSCIQRIQIHKLSTQKSKSVQWFDVDLKLNPGMVAIIGNKGSGKSALSDILASLCKCKNMKYASFLNKDRFLKGNYASDYEGTITWADGKSLSIKLDELPKESDIEDAAYLPQEYIESLCDNMRDDFQNEIDNMIFSYVTDYERGSAKNLTELLDHLTHSKETQTTDVLNRIHTANERIIAIERKMTSDYREKIISGIQKMNETLTRHDESKPALVNKPIESDRAHQLEKLNNEISDLNNEADATAVKISGRNACLGTIDETLHQILVLENQFNIVQSCIESLTLIYGADQDACKLDLNTPRSYLEKFRENVENEKKELLRRLEDPKTGINAKIKVLESQKGTIISSASNEEMKYHQYVKDLANWENKRKEIIGDVNAEGSLRYYEAEKRYLDESLKQDYEKHCALRLDLVREIHSLLIEEKDIYQDLYRPVQRKIADMLNGLNVGDELQFKAELVLNDMEFSEKFLKFIDLRFKGKFSPSSKENANDLVEQCLKGTDFNNIESVIQLISQLEEAATEDLNVADRKIHDRQAFYDLIYGLSYIDVNFKLTMNGRSLPELSPGERGIVLLIFYLALSRDKKPIIIDQPEDNLDNQSVYSRLVPCLCRAKKQRQVIVVTHNPNIAIACDAEQIVFSEMDKKSLAITYESGSQENPVMKKHIIDVLEGTKPAFELRHDKYSGRIS